ncbi:MAG: hypothetical protein AAFN18_02535 [Cyanobacteria bacterium J06554_6]
MAQQRGGFNYGMATAAVTLAALAVGHLAQPAQAIPESPIPVQPLLAESPVLPSDGLYLFGEQPMPNQLATAYLVFELQAGRVTGAFYMPHSSFDCVQGNLNSTELALTITDSYSQERYDYALSLSQDALIASTGEVSAFSLAGMHQIDTLSEDDLRFLETCQATYGETI